MNIKRLITISRPRFWIYELGPYIIGVAAAQGFSHGMLYSWVFIVFFIFFTLPANLFIYGINDIFDYETDRLNPKKSGYEGLILPEERRAVFTAIAISNLPFVVYAWFAVSHSAFLLLLLFFFFAGMYSAPPIRAKAKPFLDSIFSAGHYVATGLFSYVLFAAIIGSGMHIRALIPASIAAMLWAIAMHAYSAIPDIAADTKAGLHTIATACGKTGTLIICMMCYVLAAIFTYHALGILAIILMIIYIGLILGSFAKNSAQFFKIYTYFPFINGCSGMAVFFWVLLK